MAGTSPSPADLEAKAKSMNKVATKTGGGLDPAALAAMEKVYSDNGGNLGKIAGALGVQFKDGASAKDASDFAKKFLSGMIVKD